MTSKQLEFYSSMLEMEVSNQLRGLAEQRRNLIGWHEVVSFHIYQSESLHIITQLCITEALLLRLEYYKKILLCLSGWFNIYKIFICGQMAIYKVLSLETESSL